MRFGPWTRRRTQQAVAAGVIVALGVTVAVVVSQDDPPRTPASGTRPGVSTPPPTTATATVAPPLTLSPSTVPPTSTEPGGGGVGGGSGTYTLGSATISRSTFGMHVNQVRESAWPDIPVGAFRIWNTDSTWGAVEPSPGAWNFTRLDTRVANARARGASVMLVLGMPPAWAASNPDQKGYGGSPSVPKDMGQWATYVRTVASRYAGRIDAYEVWNEPNLTQFYTGSPQQLAELTRVASQQIRSVDGSAKVVSSGFSARTGGAEAFFRAYVGAGIASAVDVVGIHIYPYPPNGPESMVGLAQRFRSMADSAGLGGKPMWNTEIGYGRTPNDIVGEAAAASIILRTYLVLPAAGLTRNYWYMWDDRSFVGLYLVAGDRASPLGSAYRYADAEDLLVGSTVRGCGSANSLWSCDVTLASGQQITIAWSLGGARSFTVPSGTTVAYRWGGDRFTVSAGSAQTVDITPVIFASSAVPGL